MQITAALERSGAQSNGAYPRHVLAASKIERLARSSAGRIVRDELKADRFCPPGGPPDHDFTCFNSMAGRNRPPTSANFQKSDAILIEKGNGQKAMSLYTD